MVNDHNKNWLRAVDLLNILANAANIGIVLQVVAILAALFFPPAALIKFAFLANTVHWLTFIADPLIYTFRAINRCVRLIGRKKGVTFEEEKYGTHDWQNKADIGTIFLFLTAIVTFFIPGAVFPLQKTIGWAAGLSGVAINIFFDHKHAADSASLALQSANEENKQEIEHYQKEHYYESRFYGLLTLCLLCLPLNSVQAAYHLPQRAHDVLNFFARTGSMLVALLNIGRLTDWVSGGALYTNWLGRFGNWVSSCCRKSSDAEDHEASPRPRMTTASLLSTSPPGNGRPLSDSAIPTQNASSTLPIAAQPHEALDCNQQPFLAGTPLKNVLQLH